MDGDFEVHLVAVSCSEPPEGFARWSLRLLADKVVELGYNDNVSHETIRGILKNEIKPWQRKGWVIPPEQNGNFVANKEMVLDVYKCPFDPRYPVLCMVKSPKRLIAETRTPISASPGHPNMPDYEYRRCGMCNIFSLVSHWQERAWLRSPREKPSGTGLVFWKRSQINTKKRKK